jgi:uncharacterized membrane protein
MLNLERLSMVYNQRVPRLVPTLLSGLKSLIKPLLALCLVIGLVLGNADGAWAASSGGRVGGGSFRAPSRTYSAPSRGYRSPSARPYSGTPVPYSGGGVSPFFFMPMPFVTVGGGFGGLFTIVLVMAVAGFLMQTLRRVSGDGLGDGLGVERTSQVTIAKLQVGLLAGARALKTDLDRIAATSDTQSATGLAKVLQETTLALLRNPEYWVYASTEAQTSTLAAAETQFNRLALMERSRFTKETLTNVNGQQSGQSGAPAVLATYTSGSLATSHGSPAETGGEYGEYIVVTILVGAQGTVTLPPVTNPEDLRRAIQQLGSLAADRLMAIEVLWTPQASGDVLSADDLLAEYPHLRLI